MRFFLKTGIFSILVAFVTIGHAQIVKTIDDLGRLDSHKTVFIGKSLKELLKEVKPEIKMVKLSPGSAERPSYIVLYFMSNSEYAEYYRIHHKDPAHLWLVVNKNDFEFNWNGLKWSEQMEEKFNSYIIGGITVFKK